MEAKPVLGCRVVAWVIMYVQISRTVTVEMTCNLGDNFTALTWTHHCTGPCVPCSRDMPSSQSTHILTVNELAGGQTVDDGIDRDSMFRHGSADYCTSNAQVQMS